MHFILCGQMIKTRLEVIRLLREAPHTVRELQDELQASRQAIAYHTDHLVQRKIAKWRVEERERPTDGALVKVKVYWIETKTFPPVGV